VRELSLHLLDIIQNSREAGASDILVEVEEDTARDELVMRVTDNGGGVPPERLPHLFDPFYTTRKTRHVGLGLPLLKAAAERTGGTATVVSAPGHTVVEARFGHSNVDRAPLGDLPGTLLAAMLDDGSPRLRYHHVVNGESFEMDSAEVRRVLDGVPVGQTEVYGWLWSYLDENVRILRSGLTP
jgi:hypothetical protein